MINQNVTKVVAGKKDNERPENPSYEGDKTNKANVNFNLIITVVIFALSESIIRSQCA